MPNQDAMAIDERRKHLRIVRPRFQKAGRRGRGVLLDEMQLVTGLERKTQIRLMHDTLERRPRKRQRGRTYGVEVDDALGLMPRLMALKPDVVVVTGDHSTPALLKAHSWHPVPVLLWAPTCRPDLTGSSGERACMKRSLGPFPAVGIMPLALGHALRLTKYGA